MPSILNIEPQVVLFCKFKRRLHMASLRGIDDIRREVSYRASLFTRIWITADTSSVGINRETAAVCPGQVPNTRWICRMEGRGCPVRQNRIASLIVIVWFRLVANGS